VAGRKIGAVLLSVMAIILASGMIGAIYACPDDGNYFSPGTNCYPNPPGRMDLKIRDQDEGWRDGVWATWTARAMAPGDEFAFNGHFVGLRGNVPEIEISCDYVVLEESRQVEADTDPHTNLHPDSMAKYMVITRCVYQDRRWQIDCLTGKHTGILPGKKKVWRINDVDGDGRLTFYDLKKDPLLNLPAPDNTDGSRFEMSVRFDRSAGNKFQGDTLDLTMIYSTR
jgi:hypothetical protein